MLGVVGVYGALTKGDYPTLSLAGLTEGELLLPVESVYRSRLFNLADREGFV